MSYANILVIGGGAIGGITAALLTQKGENVIVVDADKEHVYRMNRGLRITGFREMEISVKSLTPEELTDPRYENWADIVLLAVKGLYTEKALTAAIPAIKNSAPVVSLQNGINEETISRIVGENRTIGCSITWGSTNMGPGHLMQTTDGGFIIGQWPTGRNKTVDDLAALLNKAFPTDVSDNIIGDRWTKLLITASLTGVGTCAGLTYGESIANPQACRVVLLVVTETYAVGEASGVKFANLMGVSPSIVLVHNREEYEKAAKLMEFAFSKHGATKPSMWQDIEKGRKTEVDFVNGYVVRKAKKVGMQAPANELVTRIIHQIEGGEKQPGLENLREFDMLIAHLL